MKRIIMVIICILGIVIQVEGEVMKIQAVYNKYYNGEVLKEEKFELLFLLDTEKNICYILGDLGSAKVKIITNEEGFSFIEATLRGDLMVTTFDYNGNTVHSRMPIIGGKIVPSQYYGTWSWK